MQVFCFVFVKSVEPFQIYLWLSRLVSSEEYSVLCLRHVCVYQLTSYKYLTTVTSDLFYTKFVTRYLFNSRSAADITCVVATSASKDLLQACMSFVLYIAYHLASESWSIKTYQFHQERSYLSS
jgi:hypothetical protein